MLFERDRIMKKRKKKTRVLVFGVFDFLHRGHEAFLREARRHGDELIVSVARDSVVEALKRRRPHQSEKERMRHIQMISFVSRAILGDRTIGRYSMVKKWKPDCICIGYDQDALRADVKKRMKQGQLPEIAIFRMRSYMPHRYRSSLFRKK